MARRREEQSPRLRRPREPDFARLEVLLNAGVSRHAALTGQHLGWRQIGPLIDRSTAFISGMLRKKNKPGAYSLRDLADLFDDERELWLDAGGFDVAALPPDRGYTTVERLLARAFWAQSPQEQAALLSTIKDMRLRLDQADRDADS